MGFFKSKPLGYVKHVFVQWSMKDFLSPN